jgi:hypothetical protein
MKGKAGGGATAGVKETEASPSDTYEGAGSNVAKEAKERKGGGRAKKGKTAPMFGDKGKKSMDRKPRKSGGRAGGSNANPFTSAHVGTPAKGRSIGTKSEA